MRLFVGVPVPPADAFLYATADLAEAAPQARPVPQGTWHVTLRFLGELARWEPAARAISAALEGAPAADARVAGVGAFQSPRRARVAWAGVEAPGLAEVESRVREATATMGEPPSGRDFVPHVTLARLRQPADVSQWVRHHAATVFHEGCLDRVVLYRSTLTPDGPRYASQVEFPLAAPARAEP